MLSANSLLSTSSADASPLTACDYRSASPYRKMSHVPLFTAQDVHQCSAALQSVPLKTSDLVDLTPPTPRDQQSPGPNDAPLHGPMLSDIDFDQFTSAFCRNKRKNFRPRCLADDNQKDSQSGCLSEEASVAIAPPGSSPSEPCVADLSDNKLAENSMNLLTNSSPNMADSILNELMSNLSGQAFVGNNKLLEQPLDLSNQDQLQRSKQLAELLFLKNIRNLSVFYPQLSPHMFLQSNEDKVATDESAHLSKDGPSESASAMAQADPTEMDTLESSSPIEQLLQLYGFDRDHYLKVLQQARHSQESAEPLELASMTRNDESDDQESQTSLQESTSKCGGDSHDLSMDSANGDCNMGSRTIDIEKLKQLQNLYKLNLIQQMEQNNIDSKNIGNAAEPNLFSSLETSLGKGPESKASAPKPKPTPSTPSSSDKYNFGDIFKSRSSNKPSRRPLSSWKQSISACGPGPAPWVDKSTLYSLGIPGDLINKSVPIDYTHYVKRYGNATECGNSLCRELNYREHFHCNALSCNSRVFMKKEEMIRHFKWHKKRDESLTHGFLRCSPADNCAERFRNCPHHRKQTHYHCLKRGCDKVYISTSDVQMHANYHRKDTAIIQEGFQRFRATENCLLETCTFFGQKTTHFHCRRDNCNHTFKNKADMEKHKSYHIRDEQLARDGFKKFMKHETCTFDDCRSSRVCNHIHCIRPGCSHVLHSTGQLYPHKRKHERRENELAYRKYRLAQSMHHRSANGGANGALNLDMPIHHESFDHLPEDDSTLDTLAAQLPLAQVSAIPIEDILGEIGESRYLKYIHRHACGSHQCHFELSTKSMDEHYCCVECKLCWLDCQHAVEHARKHVVQEEATALVLEETTDVNVCSSECPLYQSTRHLHCRMFGCPFVLPTQDKSLRKLEHYKFHEEQLSQFMQTHDAGQRNPSANTHNMSMSSEVLSLEQLLHLKAGQIGHPPTGNSGKIGEVKRTSPTLQVFPTGTTLTSVDGLPVLKRKRGRPPKNRSSEILRLQSYGANPSVSAPFTPVGPMSTFDLAAALNLPLKHANTQKSSDDSSKTIPIPLIMPYLRSSIQNGFYVFDEESPCPDMTCLFFGQKHFHCSKPRCYYITNREEVLLLHSRDFHDNIDIMEGFVYFDENIDCKLASCPSNKAHKHFHCTRVDCNYTFVHYSLMSAHEEKHRVHASPKHVHHDRRKYSSEEIATASSPEDSASSSQLLFNAGHSSSFAEELCAFQNRSEAEESSDNADRDQVKGNLSMLHSIQSWFHEQAKMNALNALAQEKNQESSKRDTVLFSETNPCNSPFCKLKRRNHFHCNVCNQAFSSYERLVPHTLKHGTLSSSPPVAPCPTLMPQSEVPNESNDCETPEESRPDSEDQRLLMANLQSQFSQNPNFANHFLQILMSNWMNLPSTSSSPNNVNAMLQYQFGNSQEVPQISAAPKSPNGSKRRNSCSSDDSYTEYLKQTKVYDEESNGECATSGNSFTAKSSFVEESSPNGYLRFRFNEDCGFASCVYREHQTHFHCMRKDCGYSFCDKTRFVQHTARHERLDSLMGGDFQQFRSSANCGLKECVFGSLGASAANKTSHFHCVKCDYVCADTNKVVAHRRQHEKLDSISAAGFEKYAPTQDCQKEMCNYKLKQTHYHCLTCNFSVLGLSQMSTHKLKHQQAQ